jgi:epoxide hydrolase
MTNSSEIRPFEIHIAEAELDDLRDRLARARWPEGPADSGWERGVPLGYMKGLAEYWAEGFDWREQERRLNELPQFVTEIDGQRIHFMHVRSPEPDARPLIMTHGWPSSPVEFLDLIGPLTDPRAHAGDPADAFHVVVPSLPGYGFSTPVSEPGWGNLFRVAQAWAELMSRLGYERFAVHETDVGSGVAGLLPMVAPGRISTSPGRPRRCRSGRRSSSTGSRGSTAGAPSASTSSARTVSDTCTCRRRGRRRSPTR